MFSSSSRVAETTEENMTTALPNDNLDKTKRPRMSPMWQWLMGLLFFGPSAYFCWQGDYGTFWAKPEKLKLIAKGKNNV